MREHPVLFSGPMVRAILAGTKTQTRRIVADVGAYPGRLDGDGPLGPCGYRGLLPGTHYLTKRLHAEYKRVPGAFHWLVGVQDGEVNPIPLRCPFGVPGDRLWVRETWATRSDVEPGSDKAKHYLLYRADADADDDLGMEWHSYDRWRPSIHMPRWASRITLEVTGVRVERLQDITEEDAKAEGVTLESGRHCGHPDCGPDAHRPVNRRAAFWIAWDTINGKRAHWASNPWVWVVEFRRAAE